MSGGAPLTRRAGSCGPLNTRRTRALRCPWGASACLHPSSSTRQRGGDGGGEDDGRCAELQAYPEEGDNKVEGASAKGGGGPGQPESRKARLAVDHGQSRVRAVGPRGGGRGARVLHLVGAARARAHDCDVCLDTAAAAQCGRFGAVRSGTRQVVLILPAELALAPVPREGARKGGAQAVIVDNVGDAAHVVEPDAITIVLR
jgi:hypothetical protein